MGAKKALEAEATRELREDDACPGIGLDAEVALAMRTELSAIAESLREFLAAL